MINTATLAQRIGLLLLVGLLAGCGGSSSGSDSSTASGVSASQTEWTTLGSRTTASVPDRPITTNAGAR